MRHHYELTDETRKVISGNVQHTADEMDVSDKYLHAILSGDKTDPFAPFEHLYKACLRAGNPVCHYDNKLAAHRARYEKDEPNVSALECLAQKISTDADTTNKILNAIEDGQIRSTCTKPTGFTRQ